MYDDYQRDASGVVSGDKFLLDNFWLPIVKVNHRCGTLVYVRRDGIQAIHNTWNLMHAGYKNDGKEKFNIWKAKL